jgi:hypothetical protein
MPSHPVFRAARAVVFATVCVALATTGHVMASGAGVPPLAAMAGLGALTALAAVLAGRERSLATIFGGLLAGQFMLHVLFEAAQHGQNLGHGHPVTPSSSGATMTLAHVLAAAVSAWWLRRGERAVWRLAKRAAAAFVRLLVVSPPTPVWHVPPAARVGATPRLSLLLRHVLVRRGPPSPSVALA